MHLLFYIFHMQKNNELINLMIDNANTFALFNYSTVRRSLNQIDIRTYSFLYGWSKTEHMWYKRDILFRIGNYEKDLYLIGLSPLPLQAFLVRWYLVPKQLFRTKEFHSLLKSINVKKKIVVNCLNISQKYGGDKISRQY
jgi:hypothetical protein